MPALRRWWPVVIVLGCVFIVPAGAVADDELAEPLSTYFKTDHKDERQALAERVAEVIDGDFARLERALLELSLWEPIATGERTVTVPTRAGPPMQLALRVPRQYDPRRPWPTVVALHGTNGKAEDMRGFVAGLLGEQAEEFVIAASQDLQGTGFMDKQEVSTHPADMLAFLRRHIHLDNDRVFLVGYSLGAHGTWGMGALYADQLAGIVPLAGTFHVPAREYLWPVLLDNFRHLPILACWGAADIYAPDGSNSPTGGIAGANRRIMQLIRIHNKSLPVTGIELPDRGHADVTPPGEKLKELLRSRRVRYPKRVTHWYQYPAQGSAYWMKLARFRGQPWEGGQIILKDVVGKNPKLMIARVVAGKFGELSGQIEGQTIRITARHAARFELLLHDELIDLDEPIGVQINGRKTRTYELQPSVSDLLAVAAETWDFHRPCRVRLVLRAPGGRPPPIAGIDED